VKPSIATASPSRTFASTAAARDMNSDMRASRGFVTPVIYGSTPVRSNFEHGVHRGACLRGLRRAAQTV
jgi:hypothetical protein